MWCVVTIVVLVQFTQPEFVVYMLLLMYISYRWTPQLAPLFVGTYQVFTSSLIVGYHENKSCIKYGDSMCVIFSSVVARHAVCNIACGINKLPAIVLMCSVIFCPAKVRITCVCVICVAYRPAAEYEWRVLTKHKDISQIAEHFIFSAMQSLTAPVDTVSVPFSPGLADRLCVHSVPISSQWS